MRRSFNEIHDLIIEFVIDYLQDHEEPELYNQVICSQLKLSRHTFYNHFENIDDIYAEILSKANELISDAFTEYTDLKDHLLQGIKFVTDNRKLVVAATKLNKDFFKNFYDHFEYAKYKTPLHDENHQKQEWLKEIQFHGLEGFMNLCFENPNKIDYNVIIEFLSSLSKSIDKSLDESQEHLSLK